MLPKTGIEMSRPTVIRQLAWLTCRNGSSLNVQIGFTTGVKRPVVAFTGVKRSRHSLYSRSSGLHSTAEALLRVCWSKVRGRSQVR